MGSNTGRGSGDPPRLPDDSSGPLSGEEPTGSSGTSPDPRPGGTESDFSFSDPLSSFTRTVRALLTSPVTFFRGMPRSGGLVNPLAFALICSVLAALPVGSITLLFAIAGGIDHVVGAVAGVLFSSIVLLPVITIATLLVLSGLSHLLSVLIIRPRGPSFGATFRVVFYSSFAQIFGFLTLVPLLGASIPLALSFYALILGVVGLREVHGTTTGRAISVVLVSAAIAMTTGFMLLLTFVVLTGADYPN